MTKRPMKDLRIELDDPDDLLEEAPSTKRPEFAPDEFAQRVESAEERATVPPAPAYDMLRDSCRHMPIADDLVLDETTSGVHPTKKPPKPPPPLPKKAAK